MLVVATDLLASDVFSYAAQGEMVSHHINPYNYGPFTLGAGPYVNPVDPLWVNAPAPYGPLFLMIDGFFASASLHNVLGHGDLPAPAGGGRGGAHRLVHPQTGPRLRP